MSRRKAIKTQIAEGDPRKKGKRKLQDELNRFPKTMSGIPDCPRHLTGRSREVWQFLREHGSAAMARRRQTIKFWFALRSDGIAKRDSPDRGSYPRSCA